MALGAHAVRCACGSPDCGHWEAMLGPALAPLDSEDNHGNVFVSHRGTPDMRPDRVAARDAAEGELTRRKRLRDLHGFRSDTDWCVYSLYAEGQDLESIASMFGVTRTAIRKRIARAEREYVEGRQMGPAQLEDLLDECEPSLLALVFNLVRRALDCPRQMRAWLNIAASAGLEDFTGAPDKRAEIRHELDDLKRQLEKEQAGG